MLGVIDVRSLGRWELSFRVDANMETNQIYNESCLDTLKRMPDNWLDACITSPPYYGLRSYNTEPQVWGGDENCDHIWGEEIANPKTDTRPIELKIAQGATVGSNVASQHWAQGTMGNFCECGAWKGELGLEPTFTLYLDHLIEIFREVKRVLKPTGTVWVNLGDSYAGSGKGIGNKNGNHGKSVFTDEHIQKTDWSQIDVRAKSLMNIPHRFYIRMTDELGFIQRNNINWFKPACMPSSAKDRFTVDFESIGFFTKEPRYWFEQRLEEYTTPLDRWGGEDLVATQSEGWHTGTGQMIYRDRNMRPNPDGRNMRTTWEINFEPQINEHYASYPTKLVERMIKAGCPEQVCAECKIPYSVVQVVIGKQVTESMRIAGCDENGEYHGQATKDFDGNNVQNASDVKRRILESMSQIKQRTLVKQCGCDTDITESGIVYDPFGGTATTAIVAEKLGRQWICSELQPKYVDISNDRLAPIRKQPNLFR